MFPNKHLKVLIAAYACRPNKGSEPGVGWNLCREVAKEREVWVITRSNNRSAIEAELEKNPIAKLHFIYCDLPGWFARWQPKSWELQPIYYLWQIGAYFTVRQLHQDVGFDVSHHVTYGRYCAPSFLAFLPIPFVWGPVGGGESAPHAFWRDFGFKGQIYELLRNLTRSLGEVGFFVRRTAANCTIAIASTAETATRLERLGVKRIEMVPGQTGINRSELLELSQLRSTASDRSIKFLSLGRLLHWKGFHLGLQAFARTDLPGAEYWIVGNGPQRQRLEKLAEELGISDRVRFLGEIPRKHALSTLGECDILVHPSLHDFSPTVCLEAMAAGKPVICLDLGGPAIQITAETGLKIKANNPQQAIADLAQAMTRLATDAELRDRLGKAGQQRVSESYLWETKGEFLAKLYEEAIGSQSV
ncbi:MAG: glycosyltransferase family 4 protein [Cyanosarcina radialis HA8281-LM2]|jgi:glycosyltransferase involved in cell wall biosynthesis|nr:glycosyltransferase family 4 protein [Cyanosarcina radialis HA8281-LM2]